jgi:aminodeoxychorismate lyase
MNTDWRSRPNLNLIRENPRNPCLKSGVIVFLNGKFVPEGKAVVSVFDRSFLYGDGLFETIRVFNGRPFRWRQHMVRLQSGAAFLKIKSPFTPEQLRQIVGKLIAKNKMPDSLLRLTLSRGVGVRGYSPKGAEKPVLVMTLHPAPEMDLKRPPEWKLISSAFRLPAGEPLAQFKTCNKLPQILARAEADAAGAHEALLLNTNGFVVEAAAANLFWIESGKVFTPPLAGGILPGVTRGTVLEICAKLEIQTTLKNIRPKKLARADGIFLSLSSFGIVAAKSLDGKKLKRSPLVARIAKAYGELLSRS